MTPASLLHALLAGAALSPPDSEPAPPVEILFHADLEGNFAIPACNRPGTEPPDYAALVARVRQARADAEARGAPPPLALFGGNAIAPGLFARGVLHAEGAQGASDLADSFAEARYDALALGQHDLSAERAWLERFVEATALRGMPVVATNLTCNLARQPVCRHIRPHVIIERGGHRIAVIATISPLLRPGIQHANLEGMSIENPEPTVRAAVKRLRAEGADIVILLAQTPRSETGVTELATLARRLGRAAGPDLILAGGLARREQRSATRLLQQDGAPALVGSTEGAETLARVLLPAPGSDAETAVSALTSSGEPDALVAKRMAPYRESYCARYGAAIGPGTTRRSISQDDWLRYVLSIMRREADAEIALLNRHFIKAVAFPLTGAITRADLYRAMPYQATLGTSRILGSRLLALVGPALTNERFRALGVAGDANGITVNGRPLDPTRHYRVTTIPFVAEGGDALLPRNEMVLTPLRGAPDVRDLVKRFLETQTASEDGDLGIDPDTDFGAPASERALFVGVTDLALDLTDTSIDRGGGYGAPQLTRAEQKAIKGELGGLFQLRSRLHESDTRLRVLYGYARNRPAGGNAVSAETADLLSLSSIYSFRWLNDSKRPGPRPAMPAPYARLLLESEITQPDVGPMQPRDYRHAELTTTTGAIFTLAPKLRARGGPGMRKQLLAPGAPGRPRFLLEAGVTLDAIPLGSWGPVAPRLEGVADYVFVDPADAREHQLKSSVRLSLPLLPRLFLTTGLDVFAMRQKDKPWAVAYDLTLGVRLRLDAAHQRL